MQATAPLAVELDRTPQDTKFLPNVDKILIYGPLQLLLVTCIGSAHPKSMQSAA